MQTTDFTDPLVGILSLDLSPDGRFAVMQSFNDLVSGGNTDMSTELYLLELESQVLIQLTDSLNSSIFSSRSFGMTSFVFASPLDLVPGQNSDGSSELFLYNPYDELFSQLTSGDTGDGASYLAPSLSADESTVAFVSGSDFVGQNPDGNVEAFLFDISTSTLIQLTDSMEGQASMPATRVSADGSVAAFLVDADWTGSNPDLGPEIFVYQESMGEVIQVTNTPLSIATQDLSMDDGGLFVGFTSGADQTGGNPGLDPEGFIYDVRGGGLSQVTDSPDSNFVLEISRDASTALLALGGDVVSLDLISGETTAIPLPVQTPLSFDFDAGRLAFVSQGDPTGGNPDGNSEIFYADCVDAASPLDEIPTLSQWGLIAMLGLLGLSAMVMMRRLV